MHYTQSLVPNLSATYTRFGHSSLSYSEFPCDNSMKILINQWVKYHKNPKLLGTAAAT